MGFQVSNFFLSSSDQIGDDVLFRVLSDTTLSGAATNIDTGTFAAASFLKVAYYHGTPTASSTSTLRFNNDSGSNYGYRYARDGAADATGSNVTSILMDPTNHTLPEIVTADIMNISGVDHICHGRTTRAANDGTPTKIEWTGSYDSTTQITRIAFTRGSGNIPAGSRLIVLGM